MRMERSEALARLRAPQFKWLLIVLTARSDQTFRWMPIDALDVRPMTSEDSLFVAFVEVPNANRAIVGTRGKLGIRRAPAEFKSHASIHES